MTTPRTEWPALIKLRCVSSRQNLPIAELLERYGSPEAACAAPASAWEEACGIAPAPERLGEEADQLAQMAAEVLDGLGAEILDVRQPDYPPALLQLPQPPPVLFVRGRLELLNRPGIAVVGTRTFSGYGRDAAISFVVGLTRAGYAIVSGVARGIDAIAHETALEVGGDTVAVLGCGLDVPYPPEHRELIARIAARGCVLTEFPPGARPRKHHFPQRNRIISGLARGVLVIEAAERSGTLITAEYALEEGKEVFAVPGPIHNPTSRGTNRLIQEGAALVTSVGDILEVLGSRCGEPLPEPFAAGLDPADFSNALSREPQPAASELARRIWQALGDGDCDLDRLASITGAGPAALAAALVELELAGLVRKLPGPRYARTLRARVGADSGA